jgi:hypothetical protein
MFRVRQAFSLLAVLSLFAPSAHANQDVCVSTSAELSAAFSLATLGQPTIIRLVRGGYGIGGSSLVSDEVGEAKLISNLSIYGGYAPGCTSRLVNPENTVLINSNDSENLLWQFFGSNVLIDGVTFNGNGTRLELIGGRDTPSQISVTLRRSRFVGYSNSNKLRLGISGSLSDADRLRIRIENCLFTQNIADAVLDIRGSVDGDTEVDLVMVNNTIAANTANHGLRVITGSPLLANNIIRGHTNDLSVVYEGISYLVPFRLYHNHYQTRNGPLPPIVEVQSSSADPLFVSSTNFRLQNNSTALNSGSDSFLVGLPPTDVESNIRLQGLAVERGAYESANTGQFVQTVTNNLNSGAGSLRQAIINANATPGLNLIQFDINANCPQTIALSTALPNITGSLTIDAETQGGWVGNSSEAADNARRCIYLRPATANTIANGFNVPDSVPAATRFSVLGIAMGGFSNAAIQLEGGRGHVISGSQFGGAVSGINVLANQYNILVLGPGDVQIGGPSERQRNVISGATQDGIGLFTTTGNNRIENNLIGLLPNGSTAAPNRRGISIVGDDNLIANNVISGNTEDGVYLSGLLGGADADFNRLSGNRIGLRAIPILGPGGDALRNSGYGVFIRGNGNVLGGCQYARNGATLNDLAFNEIAYNFEGGVRVESGRGNCFSGNYMYENRPFNPGLQADIAVQGSSANDNDTDPAALNLSNRGINTPVLLSATGGARDGQARVRLDTLNGIYSVSVYARSGPCQTVWGDARQFLGRKNVAIANQTSNANGTVEFTMRLTAPIGSGAAMGGRGLVAVVQRVPNPLDAWIDTSELSQCIEYVDDGTLFKNGFE